jgi:hypothetical protein
MGASTVTTPPPRMAYGAQYEKVLLAHLAAGATRLADPLEQIEDKHIDRARDQKDDAEPDTTATRSL